MRTAAGPVLLLLLAAGGAPGESAAEKPITTLAMRDREWEAIFDGTSSPALPFPAVLAGMPAPPTLSGVPAPAALSAHPAKAGAPPTGAKATRKRFFVVVDRLVDLEVSASVGATTHEVEPRVRVDIANILNTLPNIPGPRSFVGDVIVIQEITAVGVLGSYMAGKALDIPRWRKVAEQWDRYASEHGPIGWGPIAWKDPNYGDPWVNNLGHPASFYAAATYFRKRGYGFWKAFAGGMIANVLWEYLWENGEIPKSGHDLFYMNLLGSLAGAHPDLGLAWGVSPLRFDDALGHYTEFYYRPRGTVWRVFFRSEPNGHYNLMDPNGDRLKPEQKPLFVNDHSIGAAHEATGISVFVTGVSDPRPRGLSEIHGPSDVLDDVRVGLSVDALRLFPGQR